MPPVLGKFILQRIRSRILKALDEQGVEGLTRTERVSAAQEKISAISVLLGDKPGVND